MPTTCKVSQSLATPGNYQSLSMSSRNSDEPFSRKSCTIAARASVPLLLPLHWVAKCCWKRCWFPCGEISMGRRLWRPGILTEGVEILTSFLEWIMQKQVLAGHYIPLDLTIQSTDVCRCSNYIYKGYGSKFCWLVEIVPMSLLILHFSLHRLCRTELGSK